MAGVHEHPLQLIVGEDIGCRSPMVAAKHMLGWEFMAWVLRPYEPRKVRHCPQTSVPFRLGTGLSSPGDSGLAPDMGLTAGAGKAGKVPEIVFGCA
jgi:hypothetical protein